MNEELQSWTDDLIYKHALTFSHEELAGMYSLCNKREQDYLKEIKALRLILQSHGEIVEMNAELKNLIEGNIVVMEKMQERENKMIKLEAENLKLKDLIERKNVYGAPWRSELTRKIKALERGE